MSSLNVSCPICSELFKSSDDIYSTICGHVYHLRCIREWSTRSTSCPRCRNEQPRIYKIYLDLADSVEDGARIEELKAKLEVSNAIIAELQDRLSASETEILKLKRAYEESDQNVMALCSQLDELSVRNRAQSEEIELKIAENQSLKEQMQTGGRTTPEVFLTEKVKNLQQKLDHLSLELSRKAIKSLQLIIDNMELQSYLDQQDRKGDLESATTARVLQVEQKNRNLAIREQQQVNKVENQTHKRELDEVRSVVVRGVPRSHLQNGALNDFVIMLAKEMGHDFKKDDVEKVLSLGRFRPKSNQDPTCNLAIEFKSADLKKKFIGGKEKLKNNAATRDLIVYEYMGNETKALYNYAKVLKSHGFKGVYCNNNNVMAFKGKGSTPIWIFSKKHVDALVEVAAFKDEADSKDDTTTSSEEEE